MSEVTNFLKMAYPSEDLDPHYDELAAFFQQIDNNLFGLMATAGNIIIPPANVSFNAGLNKLTWDGDFLIPIIGSGFMLKVQFGPDGATREITLNDGDRVVVTVPLVSASDLTANFSKVSGAYAVQSTSLYILGVRYGHKFYAFLPQVLG